MHVLIQTLLSECARMHAYSYFLCHTHTQAHCLTLSRKSWRRTRTGIMRVPEWCEVGWSRGKTVRRKRERRTSEAERERERDRETERQREVLLTIKR